MVLGTARQIAACTASCLETMPGSLGFRVFSLCEVKAPILRSAARNP